MSCLISQKPLPQYRPNAGVCIINGLGQVLSCERVDISGAWQCPQGGIDTGETAETAAWRELEEETGVTQKQAKLLKTHPDWLHYDFPPQVQAQPHITAKGQAQKWFLFQYEGDLPNPDAVEHKEFRTFSWQEPTWLLENVVDFRQDIYRTVFTEFGLL